MAVGDCTISGGFKMSDKTGMELFVENTLGLSGGTVFTFVGADQQVWLGCLEQTP